MSLGSRLKGCGKEALDNAATERFHPLSSNYCARKRKKDRNAMNSSGKYIKGAVKAPFSAGMNESGRAVPPHSLFFEMGEDHYKVFIILKGSVKRPGLD
jgi:hypothetical protein